jgi:hypothetical protein
MKKLISIGSKVKNFRNAEHFQLYWSIISSMKETIASGLPALVPLWEVFVGKFEKEDELFKLSRSFEEAELLVATDAARDDDFREIDYVIKRRLHSGSEEQQTAARRLRKVTEPYHGAHLKPYAENTALMTRLVQTLREPVNAEALELLGLSPQVNSLETHNKEFDTLFSRRIDSHTARENAGKLKILRTEVDASWLSLGETVYAFYLANEYGEKNQELRVQLEEIIYSVNGRIRQAEEAYRRRTNPKDAAETLPADAAEEETTQTDE